MGGFDVALAGHDSRRQDGIPTLTWLVDAPALERWAETREENLVLFGPTDSPDALRERLLAAVSTHAAAAHLHPGAPLDGLRMVLDPGKEGALFRDRLPPDELTCAALFRLVPRHAQRAPSVTALAELASPLALAVALDGVDPTRSEAWLRALEPLAEALPSLPIALGGGLPEILATPRWARWQGGLVRDLAVATEKPTVAATDPRQVPPASLAFAEAQAARKAHDLGRARSAAEAFLFLVLESREPTRGRFQLNASPGLRFGRRPMEVDLLAEGPRIALEVDGHWHFQGPDAYRRDRRKDLALQRAGWVVVRVLAGDVLDELETLLANLDALVKERSHD
ncbi:MAG: DUF559 domain-containing protein [Myxococcota bacterium]